MDKNTMVVAVVALVVVMVIAVLVFLTQTRTAAPPQLVPTCGDTACNGAESCLSCPGDCGACAPAAVCGDGACNGNETCVTCGDCRCELGYTCAAGSCERIPFSTGAASGMSVICDFNPQLGFSGTEKIELPRVRDDMQGGTYTTIIHPNRQVGYAYNSETGLWERTLESMDISNWSVLDDPSLFQNCRFAGDIPDSEFRVPAGATGVDKSTGQNLIFGYIFFANFSMCKVSQGCDMKMTAENRVAEDCWWYGPGEYTLTLNYVDMNIANVEVIDPSGSSQEVVINIGGCGTAGDLKVCFDSAVEH